MRPGDLYAALPGRAHPRSRFAAEAASRGAVAALTDPAGAADVGGRRAARLSSSTTRGRCSGALAAEVYGHPDEQLLLLGVTGTNGKTTTVFLADAGLRAAGRVTGLVGTVETQVAGQVLPSVRTTPEAPDLQALLALMLERGCDAASMEVSSHALALGRVDGTTYDVAVFTNLSQDHLDFHPTHGGLLRGQGRPLHAGPVAARRRRRRRRVGTTARWPKPRSRSPRSRRAGRATRTGAPSRRAAHRRWAATFRAVGPAGREVEAGVRLPGMFNVANALLAIVALDVAGVPLDAPLRGSPRLPGVPGRMERIDCGTAVPGARGLRAHARTRFARLLGDGAHR